MTRRQSGSVQSDASTLAAYLREISRLPRLTVAQERELGARIRRNRDTAAIRRLVECNLRFVVSYAQRYRGLGVGFLELIHEGNLGLIEAARRFDPRRNVNFITYAVWWIRQAIVHALSDQARVFSVPAKLSGVGSRCGRRVAALADSLDHAPSSRGIADDLQIAESAVAALLRISGEDVSLSDTVSHDDRGRELRETFAQDQVPPVEDEIIQQEEVDGLATALLELDGKEREDVRLRFGLEDDEPKTLREIGSHRRLSRERVRQIESRAKEKLRRSGRLRSHLN